jgi:hypothetical protein
LRRIITSDGRSKAFVNGVNVPLSIMKGVGELLIDMHGQNEHQLLLRNNQQRDLLDAYAQSPELCDTLNTIVSQYNTINSQIDELSNNQDLKQQQQELLQPCISINNSPTPFMIERGTLTPLTKAFERPSLVIIRRKIHSESASNDCACKPAQMPVV